MADEVLLNKAASIEKCVARAREEYLAAGAGFASDFTRQDAAILNIQRACEACLDIGHYLVRKHQLGNPQSSRHVFELLQQAGKIDPSLSETLQKMVGFRNIAVHDYQAIALPITEAIIRNHLDDLLGFAKLAINLSANLGVNLPR